MWIAIIIIVVLVILVISMYNTLVRLRQKVKNSWSQIDVQLQRRFDLIPNLVETVKGYMTHESDVLTKVAELRTSWANAGTIHEKAELDNQLSGALKTIMAVSESYPELKANQNFSELQQELQNTENKDLQKEVFISQIEIANKLNLPIVIHTREAIYDTLEILKNNNCNKKGIFHCCPFNVDLVREGLKLGFYISFAGPTTFKNSKNAPEIIKMVPLDKMLIETDSPYLSPEPFRGKRNDSRKVKYIAQKIAEVKQIPLEEVAKATYNNAEKIFGNKAI